MSKHNSKLKSDVKLWAPVGWLVLIWIVSSIPSQKLPSQKIFNIDKIAHFTEYFLLALLVNSSFRERNLRKKNIWWIYLALFIIAGLDEYHQRFIPGRSVCIEDYLANASGLAVGLIFFWMLYDRSKKPIS
ncbi:MAG: VanZ family protein [Candidatus Cloacimonadaceae bacterium]|jgi:VanZ family protein|nr:VanZ family protein [Candidatus Cloacimonadota bacterium]MCB5257655.1 VanZ family protein [Candidatus Cloacimonadota bacterium]MDD5624581.1 VanZ family protein [Candidatus Cloacimonadota bacterium]MDY0112465.1 VanZ family protein [Candidatus Syntrophosphaera sp.]